MATYNGEKYLREQIDSILKQTFKDWKLIMRDDGSKDRTIEILNEYEKKDKRIKVLQDNKGNLGVAKNFEELLKNSSGEYVMFSDQDDYWMENKIEKYIKVLEKLDKENLKNVAMALKNVKIIYADYRESESFIDEKTFVYIDPPYRPLNTSSSFTSYTENDFSDKEQIELAEYIDLLNKKKAKIVMSNSDPKNNNIDDNFFDKLYKNYNINRVKATRMLNSNASLRGAINELLITNYK